MKKRAVPIGILLSMIMLLGACGKSEFGLVSNNDTSMTVNAKNAAKGDSFMSGSIEVGDNEKIVIESNLEKGEVKIELYSVTDDGDINHLPTISDEPVIMADLKVNDSFAGEVEAGTYMLKATCIEKATGTIQVLSQKVDKTSKVEKELQQVEERFIQNGDKNIYVRIYRPDGKESHPVIILCHGLGANSNAYKAYADELTKSGYMAVYFDFCGGGADSKSDGKTTEMSVLTEAYDLSAVLDEVLKMDDVDGKNVFLMGESQGGFVAAYEAAQRADDVKGLVLFYPAFVIRDAIIEQFGASDSDIPDEYTILGLNLGKIYGTNALSVDIFKEIKKYNKPVLILHGDKDHIVPYSYSEKAVSIYEDAELICIEGSDHGFNGADEDEAGDRMIEFMDRNKDA